MSSSTKPVIRWYFTLDHVGGNVDNSDSDEDDDVEDSDNVGDDDLQPRELLSQWTNGLQLLPCEELSRHTCV